MPGSTPKIILLPGEGEDVIIKEQIYKQLSTAYRNRQTLGLLLKVAILLLTVYFLYEAIFLSPEQTQAFWRQFTLLMQEHRIGAMVMPLLLLPLNWGLEARKWQLLAAPIERLSYGKAFKAVVVGVTLGVITPNRLGDYAARMLLLKDRHRLKGIGGVLLGRLCQMHSTVLFGCAGLLYFMGAFYASGYPFIVVGAVVTLVLAGAAYTLFLYHTRLLLPLLEGYRPLRLLLPMVVVLQQYRPPVISHLLVLSALRYCVFTAQFVLLLRAAGAELPLPQYFAGVTATFLVKSLLPSFSLLSDLGVREISAMHFFGLLKQPEAMVLSASVFLWLINIAVPAVAGLLFLFQLKLFKAR